MAKEHYDREIFFSKVRSAPFPGSLRQEQVDGMNAFLDFWQEMPFTDRRWLAYCLGTQPIETAWTMQPIEEYGRGAGYPYGQPDPETGQIYYGRGYVQLTWKDNYAHAQDRLNELGAGDFDLLNHPELALQPPIAADIMCYGMAEGWFTGKKLSDYFNDTTTDWVNARRIVNGTDRATEIAGHAEDFYAALSAAATTEEPEQPEMPDVPELAMELDPITWRLIQRLKARTGGTRIVIEFD